ncbi:hypothetical protein [Streptomyces ipomoeae]|uniref:hypothetical protein n=1 Tax=Streptomyces ipomoeae TaxID=103232 RepID=UPI001146D8C6|nr:hypothetical protein [Streptomyces ipomoeae]MDX2933275.1 hypothetical protein [Streptomyces ipomoeae]TQE19748.1 hypothetical protein SipoB123_30260 [Streptomyces ipomoeae]
MGSDPSLTYAFDRVQGAWRTMAARGEFTEQTLDEFGLLLKRGERSMQLRGIVVLGDVTADPVEDFVTARGHSRHGRVTDSAAATMRLRRSVVRTAYRTLRELGPSDADPARDIVLPARAIDGVRPPAGGHSGEIGHIRVRDLDVSHRRVWMHGSTKVNARWCPLDDWALNVLTSRAEFVSARQLRKESAPNARLAVSDRHGSDAYLQARACVALGDLLRRIGLGDEEDVKPSSITAWAAVAEFERTGRIEDAARRLGLRSLDRAAAVRARFRTVRR